MNEILSVKNVTKYYGNGSIVTKALDGLSFSVSQGDFTAIMGPSGSGKSTLLNLIATIDKTSSGEIILDGKNLAEMKNKELSAFRRDKLGFVFQEYNLLDVLTVEENILLPLNLQKEPRQYAEKRLREISQMLGICDQLNKFPKDLSGGEKQRAACARAIITSPAIILADEPTGALDSKNSKILMKTFQLMNQRLGSTILTVTHDAVVGSYADRVLFLKDGKIWTKIDKGDRDRKTMYGEILSVTAALGGDSDVG